MTDPLDALPAGPDGLLLDADDGPRPVGPATVDSDDDGRVDTAVAPVGDGLLLATDLDADAHVDVTTTVTADGRATTAVRDPGGTLPAPPAPGPAADGPVDPGWGAGWDAPAPPAPWLDPRSGAWIRPV